MERARLWLLEKLPAGVVHQPAEVMESVSRYWKAVVGFAAPGAVVIGAAVLPGTDGGTAVTQAELVTALVAMVVTAAGVYATPNKVPDRAA
jgi:hypothetical protein